jgi:hypothetical protein
MIAQQEVLLEAERLKTKREGLRIPCPIRAKGFYPTLRIDKFVLPFQECHQIPLAFRKVNTYCRRPPVHLVYAGLH